ncbi:MAG: carboxylating nicotinate-nucleotide diphosphorylase [Acidimicrobiia bacterium]|nr:carboxylating nicotinate-nucleotide diphosphorylase [Acidimicrobiia bacterium]
MIDIIENLVELALAEDFNDLGDVTSLALFDQTKSGEIAIVSRSNGVLSGCTLAKLVLEKVDPSVNIKWHIDDGQHCVSGQRLATIDGPLASILKAERTVLNFLCHLSGVATYTNCFVSKLDYIGSVTKIRDTRKTTPGYRALEKAAVVHGGGVNHRMGLYDAFLVKDNHLAGSTIDSVVEKCREYNSDLPLEVEVDSLEQLKIVALAKPDLILLDNFTPEMVTEALALKIDIPFEVSGGINISNISLYGKTNVKYIAIGALTHSAPILDIGFDLI